MPTRTLRLCHLAIDTKQLRLKDQRCSTCKHMPFVSMSHSHDAIEHRSQAFLQLRSSMLEDVSTQRQSKANPRVQLCHKQEIGASAWPQRCRGGRHQSCKLPSLAVGRAGPYISTSGGPLLTRNCGWRARLSIAQTGGNLETPLLAHAAQCAALTRHFLAKNGKEGYAKMCMLGCCKPARLQGTFPQRSLDLWPG